MLPNGQLPSQAHSLPGDPVGLLTKTAGGVQHGTNSPLILSSLTIPALGAIEPSGSVAPNEVSQTPLRDVGVITSTQANAQAASDVPMIHIENETFTVSPILINVVTNEVPTALNETLRKLNALQTSGVTSTWVLPSEGIPRHFG